MPALILPPDVKLRFHEVANLKFPEDAQLIDLAFSPDGSLLAVAFRTFAYLYEHVQNSDTDHEEYWGLKAVYTIENLAARITCMNWTASTLLVFGFDNGDVSLMMASSEENILVGFQASDLPIKCIEIDQKSRFAAVVAGDDEVGFWEIPPGRGKGRVIAVTLDRPADTVFCASAFIGADWQARNYLPALDNTFQLPVNVCNVRWFDTTDKPTLVVAYQHQGIVKWEMDFTNGEGLIDGNPVRTQSPITSGIFSPTGELFLIPNGRNGYSVFEVQSGLSADEFVDYQFASAETPDYFDNDNAAFMFGEQWLVGASVGKLNLWEVKSRVLAQGIDLEGRFDGCSIGKIATSGVRRANVMENIRIAASLSHPFQQAQTTLVICKAFLMDEAVNAPILVQAATAPTGRGGGMLTWMLAHPWRTTVYGLLAIAIWVAALVQ
ncbi:hypothetical protein NMY22_g7761 [Coprinellus aureogranulatus]|nr:hypothetical protein NMY22_g7761 [Coprinellus aureogranulatus]